MKGEIYLKAKINFNLQFGIIWEIFCIVFTVIIICSTASAGSLVSSLPFLIFIGIFHIIGIFLLRKGVKQYKKDRLTALYGTRKYALLKSLYPNGSYRNNSAEYDGEFEVFEEDGSSETYKETVGFHPEFEEGDYVIVLQYNDDINIVEKTEKENVPKDILKKSKDIKIDNNVPNSDKMEVGKEVEEVIIDGKKYIRKDN